jgi:hypothetical protein
VQYPQKPLDIFGKQKADEQKELPDKHSAVEDSIRAQSARIDAVLTKTCKNSPTSEVVR